MTALSQVHEGARVLVLVGPGGVGKTTLAAALAIDAADRGRRVALVTIDPARRLADALGLGGGLDDSLSAIDGAPGLEAAMLDTRASFDALVGRIADGADDRDRILANRVYRAFSRTLARPHAYVAMERLHDLVARGAHDLVVLDTPPTRSALDILDAPGRLARFVGSSVAETLVSGLAPRAGLRGWARARGRAVAGELLSRLLGEELSSELASFFGVFLHLRAGFAARAEEVRSLLLADDTRFVLAVAPDASHLDDARALAAGLTERGVTLDAVLWNRVARVHTSAAETAPRRETSERVLLAARAHRDALLAQDRRRRALAAGLLESLAIRAIHLEFPWESAPPVDLAGLRRLAACAGEFALREVSS